MPFHVVVCPAEAVSNLWPRISNLLAPAIARSGGRINAERILESAASGKSNVWIMVDSNSLNIEAAAVTELRAYPESPRLHVMLVGGTRMSEWIADIVYELKRFAIHNGAAGLEVYGRSGWARELLKHGFTQKKVVLMEMNFGESE